MQTFLVSPSFSHSLHVLDRQRCNKQVSESLQILNALTNPEAKGWRNHPAAKMWANAVPALGVYTTLNILEWVGRGYNNTRVPPYDEHWQPNPASPFCEHMLPLSEVQMPRWLGDPTFHASHRSNLLRKAPDFYSQYRWTEPSTLEYVWPDP